MAHLFIQPCKNFDHFFCPFLAIFCSFGPFLSFFCHFRPFYAIIVHFFLQFQQFWSFLVNLGNFLATSAIFFIWSYLANYDHFRDIFCNVFDSFGLFWPFMANSWILGKFLTNFWFFFFQGAPCPPDPPFPEWNPTESDFFIEGKKMKENFREITKFL